MVGHLELILGCMFSGKSTELIRRIRKNALLKKKYVVINHESDVRYNDGQGGVCSHDSEIIGARHCKNIGDAIEEIVAGGYDTVFIDEGQFFHDLYESVIELVETHGKNVVVSALDGTYERRPFMNVICLVPYADEVVKLNALCLVCRDGTPAAFSKRLIDIGDKDEFVGGTESYVSVCRKHYVCSEP